MKTARIFVVTGATSGLGLEAVKSLCENPTHHVLVGAREPNKATALAALVRAGQVRVIPLDTSSLKSVDRFADAVTDEIGPDGRIAGLANNAGLQIFGDELSADGYDMTFAANYLGHFKLTHLLLDRLAPGAAVVTTASGTHDPNDRLARRFNFRGGLFPNAAAVATGTLSSDGDVAQTGRDRYATSKLCCVLMTKEMARRVPAGRARFIAFDPGLMPGTNLARQFPAPVRFAWHKVMPAMARVWPGVSSASQSGAALAKLLSDKNLAPGTGLHMDYGLRHTNPSRDAQREDLMAELYAFSRQAIETAQAKRPYRTA
ncbi:MAG: SDR family NAD(P)-dependent oxidoreductase [Hyphomicrobiales bacterium]|nr:SDR family NAD(P)-dependent oxidoreductase [Hyphomicrobiales bacterium]